ncbi:MAG: DUF962 domain-containing protein [Alphaproteobacteria bacterium]|nr:DUF962 domain-containing protein [Alphaproteobacteria bacterium]MCB9698616.1 DUF962 domain-containing protein [Alphaproteobacteria bacterium]
MTEARAYWERYLWHHRDPLTRRLHRVGSLVVLAGIGATLAGAGWVWLPLCTAIGYGFAFAGHWFVEKNRPLTFENPLRAGIANWVMFVYELFWDVEAELRRIAENPPDTADMGNQ